MKKNEIYHPLMAGERWTERISTPECIKLMKLHRDICEEEISYLDNQGYIDTRKAFPRRFLNKYFLYQHLRKHDRCPKCGHAEKILKSEKKKTTKE